MGPHRSLLRGLRSAAVLLLSAAALAQEEAATVHGRAIDRDGKPMAGCAVGLFDLGARFDTKELLASPLTTTDAGGRYTLTAKQNHYHVVVVATKGHQVCVQRLQEAVGAVRYMPDALMLPGTTLRGRVRDTAGKPIAGACVRVEDPLTANEYVMAWFETQARSDAKGIFEVPGVPRTGLRVTASAPGFPAQSRLASHDTPLDFTLVATGLVRGRVVDGDGRPMAKVNVNAVTVERQEGWEQNQTDDEGRFAVTVPRAQRFRVAAYEGRPPHRQFSSGLLRGPASDVVVSPPTGVAMGVQRVTVRCIDASTKTPIEDFRAVWSRSEARFSTMAVLGFFESAPQHRGEAVFDVTADSGSKTLGTIIAGAAGRGFAVVSIPDDPKEPVVVELPTECFLTGTVLDAETGKPAVGAAVRALPHASVFGGAPDPWKSGPTTDADGRYRIGGLAAGVYDVQVYGKGRAATRSARVTIGSDKEVTLDLKVPKPRYLEFELVGKVPPDCLGHISFGASYTSSGGDSGVMLEAPLPSPPNVALHGPRVHKLGPIGNGQYRAGLQLPTRDRLGSCLTIDLGEIDGSGAKLELPDLRQFLHTGRVQLPSDVAPERVALLAHRVIEERKHDPFAGMGRPTPFAVCLGSDGGFVIDLAPGRYAFQLVDLETGLAFHTEEQDRALGAETVATPIVITPTIRWLDVAFEPTVAGGEVVCQMVSFDIERPRSGELSAVLGMVSGSNERQRSWWAWRAGTARARWLVGSGTIKVSAMQTFEILAPASNGYRGIEVDSATVDATGPETRVTLRIPPPPDDATIVNGPGRK